MSLPAITKHLKVLEKAGLITKGAMRNGGRAGSMARASGPPRTGWKHTVRTGKKVSIAWAYLKTVTSTSNQKGKSHGRGTKGNK